MDMDWKHKRVGILMGGMSAEREISVATGEAVHSVLADRGYEAHKIFVDRDLDLVLRQANIQVAFNALRGRYGEDGCVQGLLEVLGIPYTGSGVLASALAMNKLKTKEVLRLYNLPTPPGYAISADGLEKLELLHGTFGYPCVVKPAAQGSSVGVTLVHSYAELELALEHALRFGAQALVERYIEGMEITVGVLGDRVLGAMEICTTQPLFDYNAKYGAGETAYHIPARLSRGRYQGVLTQALMATRALGCGGVARVDMLVSENGNEFILEINGSPGLAPQCMIPKIAHFAGLSFGDLVEEVLQEAHLSTHVGGGLEAVCTGKRHLLCGKDASAPDVTAPH
jgi:D-alanine-D-alanine ligase